VAGSRNESPGPGSYETARSFENGAKFSMGLKRRRMDTTFSPGPSWYEINETSFKEKVKSAIIGTSKRAAFVDKAARE
jgi:hypothetical protein